MAAGLFYSAASFRGLQDTLVRELRQSREETDRLAGSLRLLAGDSNEARMALGLPARAYPELEDFEGEGVRGEREGRDGGARLLPYYQAVELLLSTGAKNERDRRFNEFLSSEALAVLLQRGGYKAQREGASVTWVKGGRPWFSFFQTAGGFAVRSFKGGEFAFTGPEAGVLDFIESEGASLASHFAEIEAASRRFYGAVREASFTEGLKNAGLFLEPLADSGEEIRARLTLTLERDLLKLSFGLDKKTGEFFIGERRYADFASFYAALSPAVAAIDMRGADALTVERVEREMRPLFEDSSFAAYLGSKGLSLSSVPQDDEEYVYYDFFTSSGKRAGSLGIQKKFGEIYLFDDEYVSLGSLKTIGLKAVSRGSAGGQGAEAKKKQFSSLELPVDSSSLSRFSSPGRTVLIAGAHERMADTIIIATILEEGPCINLLSLPRDLFYKNRKINSIYFRYGPERFMREVADITGLAIDNYVIIDMFAFIDVINILGGIDITLAEALVDPTYHVRDNGRWSTLFYPEGTHHLSGVEALRVARSRHFTSDFGRSRRQQLILASIKEKLKSLGVSDMGTLYELAGVLSKYVETNFTSYELVRDFVKYRDAGIRSQTVLDTTNVLYSSYTNLKHMNLSEEEVDEEFDKGAYILLPQGDDWAALRGFVRHRMNGSSS